MPLKHVVSLHRLPPLPDREFDLAKCKMRDQAVADPFVVSSPLKIEGCVCFSLTLARDVAMRMQAIPTPVCSTKVFSSISIKLGAKSIGTSCFRTAIVAGQFTICCRACNFWYCL